MKKVKIIAKERVYDGFLKLDRTKLELTTPDDRSEVVVRETMERGDSAAALLFDRKADRAILVNQFRHATYEKGPGWILETVAGVVETGETPEATIKREILEEAGYDAERLEPVATFYVSPGGSSERIFLYLAEVDLARRVTSGGGVATEDEDIEVRELDTTELFEMLDAGKIHDAKTIIALQWLRRHLGR